MLRYLGSYPCVKYGPWKVPGISALLLLYKRRTLDSSPFLFWLQGHRFWLNLHKLRQHRFAGKQPRIWNSSCFLRTIGLHHKFHSVFWVLSNAGGSIWLQWERIKGQNTPFWTLKTSSGKSSTKPSRFTELKVFRTDSTIIITLL